MREDGKIDYIEWPASDLPPLKTFYAGAFGWGFTDYGPTYAAFEAQEGVERRGVRGRRRPVPERDVGAELAHEGGQVQRAVLRHSPLQRRVEARDLGRGQLRPGRDLAERERARGAHREDRLLRHLGADALHDRRVADGTLKPENERGLRRLRRLCPGRSLGFRIRALSPMLARRHRSASIVPLFRAWVRIPT